jgi:hypothetical protein
MVPGLILKAVEKASSEVEGESDDSKYWAMSLHVIIQQNVPDGV